MKKPTEINILGTVYSITYINNPADLDPELREVLWGHIDHYKREIRVYDNKRSLIDILKCIMHEALHVINDELHLKAFAKDEDANVDNELDTFATILIDTMVRNSWIVLEDG